MFPFTSHCLDFNQVSSVCIKSELYFQIACSQSSNIGFSLLRYHLCLTRCFLGLYMLPALPSTLHGVGAHQNENASFKGRILPLQVTKLSHKIILNEPCFICGNCGNVFRVFKVFIFQTTKCLLSESKIMVRLM